MSWTSIDRYVKGKVEVYRASTLLYTLMPNDYLKSIEIVSSPVKAFFGYAMSQQTTITFIDKLAELAILEGDIVRPYIGIEDNGTITYIQKPDFIVGKVDRKQNGMDLIVEGYDLIEKAKEYKPSSLAINLPCNLEQYFNAVCAVLGCQGNYGGLINFTITELPNYDDNNTLRDILNDLAGACGCICYMSGTVATMKPLTASNPHTINKADYFSLTTGTPLTLTSVISSNPLGDNVESGSGIPQILNDNGFLVNRTDKGTILDSLRNAVYGLTVVPYELEWRGNPNVELGDCIKLESKNGTITTFYLSESMSYSGGLKASSNFDFTERDALHTNSSTIGERLNETIAKVDKLNKTIELRVEEAVDNNATIAELKLSVGQIQGTVADLEGDVIAQQTQITQTSNAITLEAQARSDADSELSSRITQTANSISSEVSDRESADNELSSRITQTANNISSEISNRQSADNELRSLINQQADSITLQVTQNVKSDIEDEYYAKQSSVDITANGIAISSTGSINLSSGAKFTVDASNFKVNSNGYLTSSGATLNSATINTATATNLTIKDGISLVASSNGAETINIDSSARYNGLINLGGNLKLYGGATGNVIYSNSGNFQVFTTSSGVSRIYLNGDYIESFDGLTGEAVFG